MVCAFTLVAAALQPTAVGFPQEPEPGATDRFAGTRAWIRQYMEERGLPSVAVAVAKDGEILWEEAFGWADRERRVAASPHTLYSLASISKPITATGIMRLVEEGKIALDRPANDYLGAGKLTGLAGDASGATVRRLLAHTAGLPLHYRFFYEGEEVAPPEMDEGVRRYGIVVNPPGEVFQYSNFGYGVLEHILARVSGMTYADYLRAQVFLPLDMTRTSVHRTPELEPYAAARYDGRGRRIPFYRFDHDGASAVWSTAHDLVRFGMFHLKERLPGQRRILSDAAIEAMQRVETPPGAEEAYGLGWFIEEDDHGYRRVYHSGSMPGVSTMLNLYPSERLVVVVLINTLDREARVRIAQELAAAVLPKYAAALRERLGRAEVERREGLARGGGGESGGAPFSPPPELLGRWSGKLRTYDGEVPFTLVFQPDGDVHVRLGDQLETLLNGASFRNRNLVGRFGGTIPTADARRRPHSVLLNLRLRNGALSGQATAQTTEEPIHFALTSWVELARAPASR